MNIKRIAPAFAILLFAMIACQLTGNAGAPAIPTVAPALPLQNNPPVSSSNSPAVEQDVLVALYEHISSGVVAILTDQGQGSGFVYDTQGHILTNYHVVEGAKKVEVDFMSGYKTYGTVMGTDLDSDLAVINVDVPAEELHPVPLGDSDALKVGQTVVAIGNPFGLSGTMTVGIISALGRTLESAHATAEGSFFTAGDIIQTDAAINPGNSGGPLFNLNGEVVGVNRAIRTLSSTNTGDPVNSGIGFAVSVNVVKRVVPVLISQGKYDYPYLGISSRDDLTLDAIELLGLKSFTGAYVAEVTKGGPADKAGLHAGTKATSIPNLYAGGDLITAIDGVPVRHFDDMLSYLIANKSPGDVVVLTVMRGDQTVDISVTLGKRP
jgi:S1-C subfamily serine protease